MPPLTNQSPGPTCGAVAGCTDIHHQEISLAPGNYGNLSVNSNTDAHLSAGTYNLNSVVLNGGSTIIIDSGPVIFNITGCATLNGGNTDCATYLATAADFTGGNISNAGLNPRQLQIQYAGTGAINLRGGAQSSALVFAPRASVTLGGGGDFYGSIIGYTVAVSGNGALHYDRNLQNTAFMIGNYMLQSFTWNKY